MKKRWKRKDLAQFLASAWLLITIFGQHVKIKSYEEIPTNWYQRLLYLRATRFNENSPIVSLLSPQTDNQWCVKEKKNIKKISDCFDARSPKFITNLFFSCHSQEKKKKSDRATLSYNRSNLLLNIKKCWNRGLVIIFFFWRKIEAGVDWPKKDKNKKKTPFTVSLLLLTGCRWGVANITFRIIFFIFFCSRVWQ